MKVHLLQQEQYLPAPLDEVFPFFARPENLGKLTPTFLGFELLTPSPIPMHVGAMIDYVVSVNGIPMRWTTCISEFEPPHRFVDVQLKGPYSFWHHTHTFEAQGEGTLIRDEVRYALPFGPFGEIAHARNLRIRLMALNPENHEGLDFYEDPDEVARVLEHVDRFAAWAEEVRPEWLPEIRAARTAVVGEAGSRRKRAPELVTLRRPARE